MPSTISLCMITKNEESYLEQCLNSVKDIVDEIIVVDTGSKDKTKEIAKKFNAKIFDFKWIDDFSAARNESLRHATKDWILVLDGDEIISRNDLGKLRDMLLDKECVGYYFTIRTYTNDSRAAGWISSKDDIYAESKCASGWYATKLIRLFRNNPSIKFKGVVHETIDPLINTLGIVKDAIFPLHHYGRFKTNGSNGKKQLYKKLGEAKLVQKPDFHSYAQLGIQAQESGDYEKAIEMFKKSIELDNSYFKAWLNLGACLINLDRLEEAQVALQNAIGLNPEDHSAHNNLGIVYSKLNKPSLAIEEFLVAIRLNPRNASTYLNLGLVNDSIGAKDRAYEAFKKAIELNPIYKGKIKLD